MYQLILFSFLIDDIIIIPNHISDPLVLLWWWQPLLQTILWVMMIHIYLEIPPNDIWSQIFNNTKDGHHVFLIGRIPKKFPHIYLPMKSKEHSSCISMNTRPHPKASHSKKNVLVKLGTVRTNKVHMVSSKVKKYWWMVSLQTHALFLSRVVKGVIILP